MKKRMLKSIALTMIFISLSAALPGAMTIDQRIADLEQKLQTVQEKDKIAVLNDLALVYRNIEQKKSMEYAGRALTLSQKFKDRVGEATALGNMAESYRLTGDMKKALEYAEKSLKVSEKSGNKRAIAESSNIIGIVYAVLNKHDNALEYYGKSLQIREETGDKKGTADCLSNMGILYMRTGDYEKALRFHLQALKKREELGNKGAIAHSLFTIGKVYLRLEKYGKDLEYFHKALKAAKEIGDKRLSAASLNSIGNIYGERDDFDKALEYFLESLRIKEEIGNKRDIATTLNNIGNIYKKMSRYDGALEYFEKTLETREEIGHQYGIASTAINMGGIYTELKRYDNAFVYLDRGLNIAKEIKAKDKVIYGYESFSALYEAKGDYKKALEYYRLAAQVKDTVFNEKISRQIAQMQTQYDTLKKEKTIEVQELSIRIEKFTRNVFVAGFLLVLVILILLFRKYLFLFSFWKKQKYIGQFRLVEEIGSGGMGIVYKAHSIRDKTDTAAVKILRQELFKDETGRKRFMQEGAIIDKLDHPNIIKIFQRGEYKDRLFIAMELLQGETLDTRIEKQGKIDLQEGVHIMAQVSGALQLIHGKDIIHRDLKPSNIMLTEKDGDANFVKLLDFGLAKKKFQTRITGTGILIGTINYMSPEQLADSEFTPASDIYSLGVTFYEMLTGRPLFPGETTNEIIRDILESSPIEPVRFRPGMPAELNDLIMKMLEKEKETRPVITEVFENLQHMQARFD